MFIEAVHGGARASRKASKKAANSLKNDLHNRFRELHYIELLTLSTEFSTMRNMANIGNLKRN